MTCIVGLQHQGIIYIGGDSLATTDDVVNTRLDEKVFFNGPMVIGFTHSFRMGQLLRYSLKIPRHTSDKSDMEYLTTTFINTVRKLYTTKGFLRKSTNEEELGGTFLLGYKGKLYSVADDFQITTSADDYMACGSGWEIALGALYATPTLDPILRINRALAAASHFHVTVRDPFVILKLGKKLKTIVQGISISNKN
jgi:ATP-dependent protease HslVU (ClpYQ) peptidase subunit